jgi:hypothetical protein
VFEGTGKDRRQSTEQLAREARHDMIVTADRRLAIAAQARSIETRLIKPIS